MALDINNKNFVIYIAALNIEIPNIYLFWVVQIRLLKANKISTTIFAKYFDYINIFSSKLIIKFLKYTSINNYTIELDKDKKLSYSLIYSLGLIELKMLKVYIRINLVISFIKPSKLPARILIFFDYKFNRNLRFYINYCSFHNLIIKN